MLLKYIDLHWSKYIKCILRQHNQAFTCICFKRQHITGKVLHLFCRNIYYLVTGTGEPAAYLLLSSSSLILSKHTTANLSAMHIITLVW